MRFGGRQAVRPVCVEVALAFVARVPRATPEHWKHQLLKGFRRSGQRGLWKHQLLKRPSHRPFDPYTFPPSPR